MNQQFSAQQISELLGRQHKPSAQQTRIITAGLNDPVLVVAGAGSGKTETMSDRVLWLLANGKVQPEEILGLTFTRKAAGELAERIGDRIQQLAQNSRIKDRLPESLREIDTLSYRRPEISTYNSFAAQIVTDHSLLVGLEPETQVGSGATLWQLAAQVISSHPEHAEQYDKSFNSVVQALLSLTGELRSNMLTPDEVIQGIERKLRSIENLKGASNEDYRDFVSSMSQRAAIARYIPEYEALKRANEIMDFSDQVALAVELAQNHHAVRSRYRTQYRVVLLDEYQDTSPAQLQLLEHLFGEDHNGVRGGSGLMAVGDPHQAIYGWRGASSGSLNHFVQTFGSERVQQMNLSTSWRNPVNILRLANHISTPLNGGPVQVEPLQPRGGADAGVINIVYERDEDRELQAMVQFFTQHWQAGKSTAAVLCRKRVQFDAVEKALTEAGFPVEVAGLAGLLGTPEITELRCCLYAAFNPARADQAMRLITGNRFQVGLADLYALRNFARNIVEKRQRDTQPRGVDQIHEEVTIIDALELLPQTYREAQEDPDLRKLSAEGFTRLQEVQRLLTDIRRYAHLTLVDLLQYTVRRMYLDVEISSRIPADASLGRRRLTNFYQAAQQFTSTATYPTMNGFLDWLEIAEDEDRGLEDAQPEINPNVIQISTIHTAKGLEWDVVAVPGQMGQIFPATKKGKKGYSTPAWINAIDKLPQFLRQDGADLPVLNTDGIESHSEFKTRKQEFGLASGTHELNEERRLAYVAITRAKSHLWLSGSAFRKDTKTVQQPGLFLIESAGNGAHAHEPDPHSPIADEGLAKDLGSWVQTWVNPEELAEEPNPLQGEAHQGLWPQSALRADLKAAGAKIQGKTRRLQTEPSDDQEFQQYVDSLVRLEQPVRKGSVIPPMTSASALVSLAEDPHTWHLQRLRPVPQEPFEASNLGTAFHTWVENYFQHASLINEEDIAGAKKPADQNRLHQLQETFLASPWAQLQPVALEKECQLVVAGRVIVNRMDAVYLDPEVPADCQRAAGQQHYLVIDWKTGRQPHSPKQRRHREIQLLCYRLAWAEYKNISPQQVRAAFYYVTDDKLVTSNTPADIGELERLITSHETYQLEETAGTRSTGEQ